MGSFGLVQGNHVLKWKRCRQDWELSNPQHPSLSRLCGVACRSHLAKVTSVLGAHLAAEKG